MRKKNRHKRRNDDGTYDFVKKNAIHKRVRLGMLDYYLSKLDQYIERNKAVYNYFKRERENDEKM